MTILKKILLENWRAKLACLVAAAALWSLIHINLPPQESHAQPWFATPSEQEQDWEACEEEAKESAAAATTATKPKPTPTARPKPKPTRPQRK